MRKHEARLVFEKLLALADEIERAPAEAEALSRSHAADDRVKYPTLYGAEHQRVWPLECGYIESRGTSVANELRALVKAYGPKSVRMKTFGRVALTGLAVLLLALCAGCATDDEPTTPPCSAVVPRDSAKPYPLTCNEGGLCVYTPTSEECCVQVAGVDRAHPDAKPDPKCEGVSSL